ncbi:hypothetical protein MBLNU457_5082t1 [Dothideomycetes sp. NU457]
MKTTMLALFSIIMLALRISAQSLPSCVAPCSTYSLSDAGCRENDASCICNSPSYYSDFMSCSKISCSEADQETAMEGVVRFCMQPGVTLPEPSPAVDAKGSAATATASSTGIVAPSAISNVKATTNAASFQGSDLRLMAVVGFAITLLLC